MNVNFEFAIPPSGEYPCNDCSTVIPMPGICEQCDQVRSQRHERHVMRGARDSVPELFRWARPNHPDWATRVTESCRAGLREQGGTLPRMLVFVGPAGSGKSSGACAILNRLHDRAVFDAPSDVVEKARRSFFVSVPELLSAASERRYGAEAEPTSLRHARSASILVLDDLRPGRPGDFVDTIAFARFNQGRTTIFTTWMARAECSRHYGEGFARRVYERTIQC